MLCLKYSNQLVDLLHNLDWILGTRGAGFRISPPLYLPGFFCGPFGFGLRLFHDTLKLRRTSHPRRSQVQKPLRSAKQPGRQDRNADRYPYFLRIDRVHVGRLFGDRKGLRKDDGRARHVRRARHGYSLRDHPAGGVAGIYPI